MPGLADIRPGITVKKGWGGPVLRRQKALSAVYVQHQARASQKGLGPPGAIPVPRAPMSA